MRVRRSLLLLGTLLLSGLSSGLVAAATGPQPGTWERHDLTFSYLPLTATYSCPGLRDKLLTLLDASGARQGVQVTTFGCAGSGGAPDKMARARVVFYTLVPATAGASGTAPVMGVWQHRELTIRPKLDLTSGDCELMQQFRRVLLPKFAVRNVQTALRCTPYQRTNPRPTISFEVFVPQGSSEQQGD